MVGMPGYGREIIALRLRHYLNWLGIDSSVFTDDKSYQFINQLASTLKTKSKPGKNPDNLSDKQLASISEYFDKKNIRSDELIGSIKKWFATEKNTVAIYDAPSASVAKRAYIKSQFKDSNATVVFVEVSFSSDQINLIGNEIVRIFPDFSDPAFDAQELLWIFNGLKEKFSPISREEDSDLSYTRLLFHSGGIEINSSSLPEESNCIEIKRFLYNVQPISPVTYVCSYKGSILDQKYTKKIQQQFKGKTMYIYLGTHDIEWNICEALEGTVEHPVSSDCRNEGIFILKALDAELTLPNIEGKTYDEIYEKLIHNPELDANNLKLELNTDTMSHHVATRTMILAERLTTSLNNFSRHVEETVLQKRYRLTSVILSIEKGNPAIVIASQAVVDEIASYFNSVNVIFEESFGILYKASNEIKLLERPGKSCL